MAKHVSVLASPKMLIEMKRWMEKIGKGRAAQNEIHCNFNSQESGFEPLHILERILWIIDFVKK